MNVNEIADWLEQQSSVSWSNDFGQFLIDIATMLRQQQAEIEALKQIIDANNLSQNIGQFVKPNLKIEEVMLENCTCYKLGYSQLNNYRKVNNENNNEAA